MTPAARVQAAIEVLDAVIDAAKAEGAPADRILADYFRARRYAGSKDRRAVRELVYGAIRALGPVPGNGRDAMLAYGRADPAHHHLLDLFDGSPHGPAPIEAPLTDNGAIEARPGLAPDWLVAALARSGVAGEAAAALMGRAPLDLRVNTLRTDRASLDLPEPGEPLAAPQGLRFASGTRAEEWEAYAQGLVEVQDHGSQLACLAAAARPGEMVVDLCAGAGGKSLALAAAMENAGRLIACDTDKRRLGNLAPRAARAGAGLIEPRLLDPGREREALGDVAGKADLVLVDAPCSGTGTWRRKPEAKWRLTPRALRGYAALQDRLLDIAAALVKPGGRIVFVTCSLLDEEGAQRACAFLSRHEGFAARPVNLPLGTARGEGWRLEPLRDGTDGFFIAILARPC
ncbi:RsmB/NOP family class I SAM-dependent RNA methyltransferase [Erythrobacter sp. HL-111]|uniref:RsmB/NOP family class I SAM-dependent RNA methyltransferase n=1 Tax=Erythrobacter sp. HL-111 TaxID=1798193 RepID=UPI0006D95BC4|nr:RsmB/NOP family class I SAM-dependent RNA methyltransferase [Erythrobacter sp. HL-111]KPP96541.1 MAG: 16S rRNA (cytosine967-C5)-methyltransferase [Erythrobacteraceae bacterium HL-111]SDS05458.1 16S rRNA (cytosine967-C5)-methyltransferase [Erythrobacter sp. HL-111]